MKKLYLIIRLLTLICICLLFSTCTKKDIQKDFASFDRVYIPALSMTNQGEKEQSKTTMLSLKENWKAFKDKYYKYNSKDSQWEKSFNDVDQKIIQADEIVNSDGNLSKAHESLEGIRTIFMELRKKNNMDYYVDYLTEFHEPMEAIVLTVKGKTPDTLTNADIEKLQKLLPDALSIWNRLDSAKFDKSVFGFSDEKSELMRKHIKQEFESLNKLKDSIVSGDKKMIIQSAMGVKPNFVNVFLLFGADPKSE
jgi:hypothetical protein